MLQSNGTYSLVLIQPDSGEESVLGQVSVGELSELTLVTAPEACEEFLRNLVEQLNAKAAVFVKVPGKQRYQVSSIQFERSAPNFFEGLQKYLKHYYSIEMRSSTDFANNPQDFSML